MSKVLEEKKQEVVEQLIRKLMRGNVDLEETMNAHTVLLEIADNENTYSKLVERENLLLLLKASTDISNKLN